MEAHACASNKFVATFADLRGAVDGGAFDQHNCLAMSTITSILHRHGIPIKSNAAAAQGVGAVRLSREHKLTPAELVAQWHAQGQVLKARISRHVLEASTYELISVFSDQMV